MRNKHRVTYAVRVADRPRICVWDNGDRVGTRTGGLGAYLFGIIAMKASNTIWQRVTGGHKAQGEACGDDEGHGPTGFRGDSVGDPKTVPIHKRASIHASSEGMGGK